VLAFEPENYLWLKNEPQNLKDLIKILCNYGSSINENPAE